MTLYLSLQGLKTHFSLGIRFETDDGKMIDYFGPPLHLSDQEWRFRQLMPSVEGLVPKEGVIHTKIVAKDKICFLTLTSRNEHGMRVMQIKPTFKVSNTTGQALNVAALTVIRVKERLDAGKIQYGNMFCPGDNPNASHPLLFWQVVLGGAKETTQSQLFDGFQYVSVSMIKTNWSLPTNLNDTRSVSEDKRKTIFLPLDGTGPGDLCNLALALTTHHRDGQIFLVFSEEPKPQGILHNKLDIDLRYGQSFKNLRNYLNDF